MKTLEQLALAAWQAAAPLRTIQPTPLQTQEGDTFLVLIQCDSQSDVVQDQLEFIHSVVQTLFENGGVLSVIERVTGGIWVAAARWAQVSQCHVYINLDMLTIDPHTQDFGDFKIKAEQVEVLRQELTLKALFDETPAVIIQVRKSELPHIMTVLREAQLSKTSYTIGKAWGSTNSEPSRVDVYRDAKKQLSVTVDELNTQAKSAS